jgi:hypothetical protein
MDELTMQNQHFTPSLNVLGIRGHDGLNARHERRSAHNPI